jgi:transposase-like protein
MKKKNLTKNGFLEYIGNHGKYCPFCESRNFQKEEKQDEGDAIWFSYYCPECDGKWELEFRLTVLSHENYNPLENLPKMFFNSSLVKELKNFQKQEG